MSTGKRPGGLTALAVVNFIFGGFGILGSMALVVFLPMLGRIAEQAPPNLPPEQTAQIDALRDVGASAFILIGLLGLVSAVLLILSGIGYIKQKKLLGRTLGNVYGILGIASSLGNALMLPAALGGGSFNIGTIIGLIYPILTLALINTTFKDDLVN